jgi:hypothetical protein
MGSAETAKLSETDYEPYFRTSQTRDVRARRESSLLEPLYLPEGDLGTISRVCSDLVSPHHLFDVLLSGREVVRTIFDLLGPRLDSES